MCLCPEDPDDNTAPLAGVKILDFMWALAGPGATRILADYGATVIRVESSSKLDVGRTIRPFIDGEESPEKSAVFHSTNAGKRMITLNLNSPEGREVALDLTRWADVVTESFSPRAMKAFGLDYETLREVNPNLIMLSTCLMGQTGPLAMFAGYGNLAAAIAGFFRSPDGKTANRRARLAPIRTTSLRATTPWPYLRRSITGAGREKGSTSIWRRAKLPCISLHRRCWTIRPTAMSRAVVATAT